MVQITENRHTINNIVGAMNKIDAKLDNVTKELEEQVTGSEKFTQLYKQIDMMTQELKMLLDKATFYIEHLF